MGEKSQRPDRKSEVGPTLTAIAVSGFKSIRDEARIEIRPLTILAGANSAGKSSIMQPLLLLKQTLAVPYDPGPLYLEGPNVHFTDVRQMLWKKGAHTPSFTVELVLSKRELVRWKFGLAEGGSVAIQEQTTKSDLGEVLLRGDQVGKDVMFSLPPGVRDSLKASFGGAVVRRFQCVLGLVPRPKTAPRNAKVSSRIAEGAPFLVFGPAVPQILLGLIHLPGLRGNPARTYKLAGVSAFFPGVFQDYVAALVSEWQTAEKRNKGRALSKALESLGLTWKVRVKPFDATQVELRVGRLAHSAGPGAPDLVSVADVGFGVSQSLPVVVALVAARPNQIVYLEQPEIHLHPRAQVAMAGLLARTAARGVRLIVETHSSLLLRGVQTLVAKGELDPRIVKLHWFTRGEDGATTVSGADLDENGAFGDWPEDFGDVELQVEREYLDAVTQRKE